MKRRKYIILYFRKHGGKTISFNDGDPLYEKVKKLNCRQKRAAYGNLSYREIEKYARRNDRYVTQEIIHRWRRRLG